jgi:hypothetical protein
MPRVYMIAVAALLLAGCSSSPNKVTYQQMVEENQRRLAGDAATQPIDKSLADVPEKIWDTVKGLFNYITGVTPVSSAEKMEDASSADRRREGIAELSDKKWARQHPQGIYAYRWKLIAFGSATQPTQLGLKPDVDYMARAAAIRALNRSRARTVVDSHGNRIDLIPFYLQAMSDPYQPVRLEAAKALANIPDDRAVSVLIAHMSNRAELQTLAGRVEVAEEDQDVRIACADGLRNFKTRIAATALVGMLLDRDFAVAWQARQSLILITGQDRNYDRAAWSTLLRSEKPFAS